MMMTTIKRMTMRVRRMPSEKYIMVILLFFGVVGVCKRSLGDDHGHPLWLSSYVSRWSHEYMNLFGGTERFEQLKLSLLVDGFSKVCF